MKTCLATMLVCFLSQLSAPARGGSSIDGTWRACFTGTYNSAPVCGRLEVKADTPHDSNSPEIPVLHRVIHEVPFGGLGSELNDITRYGIMLPTEDSLTWHIQLGLRDSLASYPSTDDGSIVARVAFAGDSLVGTWDRSSWYPSRKGSVVLRR